MSISQLTPNCLKGSRSGLSNLVKFMYCDLIKLPFNHILMYLSVKYFIEFNINLLIDVLTLRKTDIFNPYNLWTTNDQYKVYFFKRTNKMKNEHIYLVYALFSQLIPQTLSKHGSR